MESRFTKLELLANYDRSIAEYESEMKLYDWEVGWGQSFRYRQLEKHIKSLRENRARVASQPD